MNVIQPLLELQEIDGRIRELEREARDIPQRKAQETARMAGVNAALDIARNQLAAAQKRAKESEAEAEAARAKATELKISQATIKSNKELLQTSIQIESLEHEAEAAENRQLAILEDEIPKCERRLREAEEKAGAEQGGVDGFVGELDERLADVKAQLAECEQARRAAANNVPPRFLLYYERLRTKRWPVVATLNAEGVCDGCHLMQPPSVAQMVQHNQKAAESGEGEQRLVACTMCGRLLYRDL